MDRKLIWTDPAIDDLAAITTHIAQDNPRAAQALGEKIISRTEQLPFLPDTGRVYPANTSYVVRRLVEGNYLIFYRMSGNESLVEILSVRHASRQSPAFD